MTDVQMLVVVLAAVYLWECLLWLRRDSVAFACWRLGRWRIRHPSLLAGNRNAGFVVATPWPPLGILLVGSQRPLSLTARHLLASVAPTVNPGGRAEQSGALLELDKCRQIQARGKNLKLGRRIVVRASSPSHARSLARFLRQVAALPEAKRNSALDDQERGSLDCHAARQRWEFVRPAIFKVRRLANALLAYLFLLCPAVIWLLSLARSWAWLLAGLVLLDAVIARRFYRAHQTLYPQDADDRFSHTLTVLLSPCSAMRAHDLLTRRLLEEYHPLALARVFCPPVAFHRMADRYWRELNFPALPVCPVDDPVACGVERESRQRWQRVVREFLHQCEVSPDEILRPPLREDAALIQYCPRCRSQYHASAAGCRDCGGLPLLSTRSR